MEHPPHIRYSEEEERYGTLGNNNLMFVKTTIRWRAHTQTRLQVFILQWHGNLMKTHKNNDLRGA